MRAARAGFTLGALVFPGGRVDAVDRDPAYRGLCAAGPVLPDEENARRVAAIRELFEEGSVLLARQPGEGGLIAAEHLCEIRPRW